MSAMKTQFIDKLVNQSWSIDRHRGRSVIASIVQRLRSERPAEDSYGNPLPKMSIIGNTAIIPIVGALGMSLPDWVKQWCVMTDVNDIAEETRQALDDPRVFRIVYDYDSPGGWSVAGNKLFDVVDAAKDRKPVLAWCGDGAEVCSAAYHGATPAHLFLTGAYSLSVGCIGTYLVALDDTEYWKMLGYTWEVFRSGELKGMGEDGFSEAQKQFLQDCVDRFGGRFRANVATYRTLLSRDEMEGQFYDGKEASLRGFTHGTAPDLTAALARFGNG